MTEQKIQPFDSFTAVYKILVSAGYFKLLNKPKNKYKWICHQIYRPLAVMVVILFNTTHITYIIQNRNNLNYVFDCSMIEIPQINLLVKIITFNWNTRRIDKINKLLKDSIFSACTKKDEEMLSENMKNINRLSQMMNNSVILCGISWASSHFVRRYYDPTFVATGYVPFKTDTWARFTYSVILELWPIFWIGHGHLNLDCLVAAYYAQAEVQLKIIKYNLEHLFDTDGPTAYDRDYSQYKDVVDKDLKDRFVHYVKRYDAVVWYTKQIGLIFNYSMTFQFFTSIATLCIVTYRMSSDSVTSVQFAFLIVLLVIMLSQVFIYCYVGNMVQHESEAVVTSVYLSDWLSTSPQFRRLLMIAMLRWSRSLTPQVAGVVPLSLTTYVSILRAAYSLYALLATKQ